MWNADRLRCFGFASALAGALAAQPQDLDATVDRWVAGELRALAELRAAPEDAVDALLRDLEQHVQRADTIAVRRIVDALQAIGARDRRTLRALLRLLDSGNLATRAAIVELLADLAPDAEHAEPLREALDRAPACNWSGRYFAIGTRQQGPPLTYEPKLVSRMQVRLRHAERQRPQELSALFETDELDAWELAAERLAHHPTQAMAAMPQLARLLQVAIPTKLPQSVTNPTLGPHWTELCRERPSAPLAAARTILAVDPRGEHALSAHACLLRHGRDDEKAESLLALRLRTDPAEDVVPLLEQFFELQVHPGTPVSRDLRIEALVTLATLGPPGRACRPALRRLAAGDDRELANVVQSTLRALAAEPRDLSGTVDRWVAGELGALVELRAESEAAVSALLSDLEERVLRHEFVAVRRDLDALEAIATWRTASVRQLLRIAGMGSIESRREVAHLLVTALTDIDMPTPLADARGERGDGNDGGWLATLTAQQPLEPGLTLGGRLATRQRLRESRELTTLLALVGDDDPDVCELAAERLAGHGARAIAAIPQLARLLELPTDPHAALRGWQGRADGWHWSNLPRPRLTAPVAAARALLAIDPHGTHALAAHACLLRHGRDDEKAASLVALRLRSDPGEQAVALLRPFLELHTARGAAVGRDLRREALVTLATIGPAARACEHEVRALAGSDDPQLANVARSTLRAIEAQVSEPAALVARWVSGELRALAELSAAPAAATAALLRDLERRVEQGDVLAVQRDLDALEAVASWTPDVVSRLQELAGTGSRAVRIRIAHLFGTAVSELEQPPRAADLLPWRAGVVESFEARQGGTLPPAIKQLVYGRVYARLRHSATRELAVLLELASHGDIDIRELAAERLARHGAQALPAVPQLARILSLSEFAPMGRGGASGSDHWSDLPRHAMTAPLAAARALLAVDPDGEHSFAAHAYVLQQGRDDEKAASLVALRQRADPREKVVTLLRPFLELETARGATISRDLRIEALVTLATLGPTARSCEDEVLQLVASDDPQLANVARSTLRAITR